MRSRTKTIDNSHTDDDYPRTAENKSLAPKLVGLLNDGYFDDLDKLDFSLDSKTLNFLIESGKVTNENVLRDLRRMRRDRTTTIRPVEKGDVPNQDTDGTAIESACSGSEFGAIGSLDEAFQLDGASRGNHSKNNY